MGVLSTLSDRQAFERAAESMCATVKPGFSVEEMRACAEEIRRRAALQRADGGDY
jgi:hypothetical protein